MMEDEPMHIDVPTSPELPADGDIIKSEKHFSGAMTLDLTDEQIKQCAKILGEVRTKHVMKFRTKFNDPNSFNFDDVLKAISEFEDEIKTRMAEEASVLVGVDTTPLLEGQPMRVEWLGVLPGGDLDRYGMDHERKEWEVKRANERGEDYLGQKG